MMAREAKKWRLPLSPWIWTLHHSLKDQLSNCCTVSISDAGDRGPQFVAAHSGELTMIMTVGECECYSIQATWLLSWASPRCWTAAWRGSATRPCPGSATRARTSSPLAGTTTFRTFFLLLVLELSTKFHESSHNICLYSCVNFRYIDTSSIVSKFVDTTWTMMINYQLSIWRLFISYLFPLHFVPFLTAMYRDAEG